MPHVFHQFGFGDLNSLPREIADLVTPISEALLALQNELAGTRFEIAKAGLRTKVIRHPRGGGFLAAHSHPFLPQRISVFLNLSEPAADYASGGAAYKTSGLWIAPFEDFRIGNLLAWRYDLTHQVLPVDPGEPLKWEGDDGFWLYGLEMDEVHKHSKLADLS
jgi:hypothetical protein